MAAKSPAPGACSASTSAFSRGGITSTYRAGPAPAFQNECGVPRGTNTAAPGPASTSSSPTRNPSVPSSTYQASSSEW